jgi:hypothetical protein
MQFENADQLRAFLRTCIDPGPGRDKRTPTRLVEALPHQYAAALTEFAPPYLGAFGRTAAELTARAEDMHHAYAATLLAWIRDEQPSDRLLELAQEATAHVRACSWCTTNGVLSASCADGRRLADALLAPAKEAPAEDRAPGSCICSFAPHALKRPHVEECPAAAEACGHESWDVTSEYPAPDGTGWVKFRTCHCGALLDSVTEPEPHFETNRAAAAAAAGHATAEETAAAYLGENVQAPADPAVLPWTELLRGAEPHGLIDEIAFALHNTDGRLRSEDETKEQRARRILADIEHVLTAWRDAVEHRRPPVYLTPDGRVWTYRGEHVAHDGPAVYKSPSSPKAFTVAQLKDMYGWVATVDGTTPTEGEGVPTALQDYARTCRASGLLPYTTVLVQSSVSREVHAAVHVSLDPHLELSTGAVDEVRTAICDDLTVRE